MSQGSLKPQAKEQPMTFSKDLLERIIRTAIAAAAGAFILPAADVYNLAAWKSALVVAATVGVTTLLGLLTKAVGPNKDSASVIK